MTLSTKDLSTNIHGNGGSDMTILYAFEMWKIIT